jgi:glycosyltransferase involved in cell wall biosynthesis
MSIALIGRFPPPIDGQTLATKRLADLLDSSYELLCIDTQPNGERARLAEGLSPGRIAHVLRLRHRIQRGLSGRVPPIALWPAISPDLPGHLRDRLAVLPALTGFRDIVAIVHRGNFEKLFASPLTSRSALRQLRRISCVVFLSHQLSARCRGWIPSEKRCVIPNTIDDAVLFGADEVAAKQAARDEHDRIELLFVGNMIAEKGYREVIDAAAILRARGLPMRVRFAGRWISKEDETRFRQLVRAKGLESVVDHDGQIADRRSMKAAYGEADLVLLPSYYPNEAQPLVILEALNAGVPVIATRQGGISEMIDDGREGFLIPPRDPASLAESIRKAADRERWHALSRAARRRFTSTFAPDTVRRQWMDLIERLRKDRRGV